MSVPMSEGLTEKIKSNAPILEAMEESDFLTMFNQNDKVLAR